MSSNKFEVSSVIKKVQMVGYISGNKVNDIELAIQRDMIREYVMKNGGILSRFYEDKTDETARYQLAELLENLNSVEKVIICSPRVLGIKLGKCLELKNIFGDKLVYINASAADIPTANFVLHVMSAIEEMEDSYNKNRKYRSIDDNIDCEAPKISYLNDQIILALNAGPIQNICKITPVTNPIIDLMLDKAIRSVVYKNYKYNKSQRNLALICSSVLHLQIGKRLMNSENVVIVWYLYEAMVCKASIFTNNELVNANHLARCISCDISSSYGTCKNAWCVTDINKILKIYKQT